MAQTIVTVHLCVKGEPVQVRDEIVRRMNEWYTEPPMYPEYGESYPDKTLLHYTVGKVAKLHNGG